MTKLLLGFFKSTKSIAVVIMVFGATIGLFLKIIPADAYMQALMLVLGGYFGRATSKDKNTTT